MVEDESLAAFDPYYRWLGIPVDEQPPDHYRLLGLVRFEGDPEVIENAADQRMAYLRSFQNGRHRPESQRLLNEISAARVCLLNADRKAQYDRELGEKASAGPLGSADEGASTEGPDSPPEMAELFRRVGISDGSNPAAPRRRPSVSPRRGRRRSMPLLAVFAGAAAILMLLVVLLMGGGRTALVIRLPESGRIDVRVTVDGIERELPNTGALTVPCEPGEHEVIVERRGYAPFVAEVSVKSYQRLTVTPEWGEASVPPLR